VRYGLGLLCVTSGNMLVGGDGGMGKGGEDLTSSRGSWAVRSRWLREALVAIFLAGDFVGIMLGLESVFGRN
jgi:hypothetical protein